MIIINRTHYRVHWEHENGDKKQRTFQNKTEAGQLLGAVLKMPTVINAYMEDIPQ